MFKFLMIVLLVSCIGFSGKAQVADTTQYLVDSVQPKFDYYIGKPLKTLLNDLKIQVVYYHSIPRWDKRLKDTIQFSQTLLHFNTLDNVLSRKIIHIKSPAIKIKFVLPIPIPKQWFMQGGRFENDNWDKFKRHFYEKYIIGEIALRGI